MNHFIYPKVILKSKIKNMVIHKIRPAVEFSKNGYIKNSMLYKSSYQYVNHEDPEQHAENIYNSILLCFREYPERYIHLTGYGYNKSSACEYLADYITVYVPGSNLEPF